MNSALVAQLTQSISQLSLRPGEEEIKKKGMAAILEMSGAIARQKRRKQLH